MSSLFFFYFYVLFDNIMRSRFFKFIFIQQGDHRVPIIHSYMTCNKF